LLYVSAIIPPSRTAEPTHGEIIDTRLDDKRQFSAAVNLPGLVQIVYGVLAAIQHRPIRLPA